MRWRLTWPSSTETALRTCADAREACITNGIWEIDVS
jgi:hypothetical protein